MKPPVALLVLGLSLAGAAAAADRADPLVKKHLETAGTPFTIDDDNDFDITVDLGDGRTQKVFVLSDVNSVDGLEVRELWSAGYRAPDGKTIPVSVANRLLEHSNEVILGSWVKQSGGHGIFVIKIPADASSEDLDTAIDAVAANADKLEKEFTGDKDEF
jgi:hypothetical protein